VALLALLSRSERSPNDGALADAVANAHARLQQLDHGATDTSRAHVRHGPRNITALERERWRKKCRENKIF
jgi:hypothetical protein